MADEHTASVVAILTYSGGDLGFVSPHNLFFKG